MEWVFINLNALKSADECYPLDKFRLVSYLRIFRWLLESGFGQLHSEFERNTKFVDYLLNLFHQMQQYNTECNRNLHQLFHLLDVLSKDDKVLEVMCSKKQFHEHFFLTFVSLKGTPTFLTYNNESLPHMYSLMLKMASASREFLEMMANHGNFNWAIHFLFLASKDYPSLEGIMRNLFALVVRNHQVPEWRARWIANVFEWGIDGKTLLPFDWTRFFDSLLVFIQSKHDGYLLCACEGFKKITNMLLARTQWAAQDLESLTKLLCATTAWLEDNSFDNRLRESILGNEPLVNSICGFSCHVLSGSIDSIWDYMANFLGRFADLRPSLNTLVSQQLAKIFTENILPEISNSRQTVVQREIVLSKILKFGCQCVERDLSNVDLALLVARISVLFHPSTGVLQLALNLLQRLGREALFSNRYAEIFLKDLFVEGGFIFVDEKSKDFLHVFTKHLDLLDLAGNFLNVHFANFLSKPQDEQTKNLLLMYNRTFEIFSLSISADNLETRTQVEQHLG
eukprot:TRINITY_DN8166_c0_g1_i2.p1 TRINITY_DN8166_c0_g1~~TRINITY_DN8166_c0_g1_i2.p1  ORF type:complete len:512 (+),score=77.53 TRINITY_DN8166_c0_g1_i2:303-1838(+)